MPKSRPRRTRNEIYKVKFFCKIKMPKQIEKNPLKSCNNEVLNLDCLDLPVFELGWAGPK